VAYDDEDDFSDEWGDEPPRLAQWDAADEDGDDSDDSDDWLDERIAALRQAHRAASSQGADRRHQESAAAGHRAADRAARPPATSSVGHPTTPELTGP
jgi:hypothetical protein